MKAHKGRIARRAGACCSVVESLESRALLSVMPLGTSSRLAPPDGSRDAVEVGSVAVTQDKGRPTNSESGGSGPVSSPGPDKNGNGNVQPPPSVDWNNSDSMTRGEAFNQQDIQSNTIDAINQGYGAASVTAGTPAGSGRLPGGITTPSLVPASGDYTGAGLEDLYNGGDSGSALQDGGDLVVPAIIAPIGGASSPAWSGPVISLTRPTRDAPRVTSPATEAPDPGNDSITDVEHPGHASPESRQSPNPSRDGSVLVPPRETGTGTEIGAGLPEDIGALDEETREPGWADLLDGAASFDWEMLDRELRQFLSRVSGRPDAPDGCGVGMTWQFWLGVLAASLGVCPSIAFGR
jgi:hypothetical protein